MSFEQKQYFVDDEEFQNIYDDITNTEIMKGLWDLCGPTAGFDEYVVMPEIKLKLAGHKYFMNHKIQDTLEFDEILYSEEVHFEAMKEITKKYGLLVHIDTEEEEFNDIKDEIAHHMFIKKYSY